MRQVWRTPTEVGERSHLHHYSHIDVNVSVNFKGKQRPFRLYLSRHHFIFFISFLFFITVRFSHRLTFRSPVLTTQLSIHRSRVVRPITTKRFDLNDNQYIDRVMSQRLFEIVISLIRRLFHVYYPTIIDLFFCFFANCWRFLVTSRGRHRNLLCSPWYVSECKKRNVTNVYANFIRRSVGATAN